MKEGIDYCRYCGQDNSLNSFGYCDDPEVAGMNCFELSGESKKIDDFIKAYEKAYFKYDRNVYKSVAGCVTNLYQARHREMDSVVDIACRPGNLGYLIHSLGWDRQRIKRLLWQPWMDRKYLLEDWDKHIRW